MEIDITEIKNKLNESKGIKLSLLRLDKQPMTWGGNKYFKLKYNLEAAKDAGKNCILTFGGAYSNHIAACAAAAIENGFKSIGIIRGEPQKKLNATLQFAHDKGMQLEYISRSAYRAKSNEKFIEELLSSKQYSEGKQIYVLPEGGSNALAVKGCKEILATLDFDFDWVCCSSGTGATLAGLVLSLKENQKAIGFSALQSGEFLQAEVLQFLKTDKFYLQEKDHELNWRICPDYAFGGYAKLSPELIKFKKQFWEEEQIELDYVYTAKMLYGIFDLISKNYFQPGSRILAIHSGGVQGNAGFGID